MPKGIAKLDTELLGILSRLVVETAPAGFVAKITDGQLERSTYVALNGALEALGGKWNRKLTGQYQTKYSGDFFQTPRDIAREMAEWAVRKGDVVLEPSAGHGRLVQAAHAQSVVRVDCYEIDPKRVEELKKLRGTWPPCAWGLINCADFLTVDPVQQTNEGQPYDSIVMNPPFSKGAEARHILHALKFLKAGGRLASVASPGVRYRKERIYCELRLMLDVHNADIEDLPDGAFSDEGTNVSTVLITLVKR